MQYAHKHDPSNPDDAEFLNTLKSMTNHLQLIAKEAKDQREVLQMLDQTLHNIDKALTRVATSFYH